MAISPIRIPNKVNPPQEGDSGGGGIGGILGAIAAAAAVVATGGLALPAAVGVIGAGATLGGMVGGAVDKAEQGVGGSQESVSEQSASGESAIARKFAQQSQENVQSSSAQKYMGDPNNGVAILEALKASRELPPQQQQLVQGPLAQGLMAFQKSGGRIA